MTPDLYAFGSPELLGLFLCSQLEPKKKSAGSDQKSVKPSILLLTAVN